MVTVGCYRLAFEAHLACDKLREEGIEAFVLDEHFASTQAVYTAASGWVRVVVPDEQSDAARGVLARDDSALLVELAAEEPEAPPIPPAPTARPPGARPVEVPAWLLLLVLGTIAVLVYRGRGLWW